MRHDGGLLPKQAVTQVGIGIVAALGLEFAHKGDFIGVFRQVRLHGQIVLAGQLAAGAQHLGRARWDEARRDDGTHQALGVAELLGEGLDVAHGVGHRLAQFGTTVAVHRHLAHKRTHASLLKQLHEPPRALIVRRGKRHATHGAKTPQVAHKATIHAVGIGQ